MKKTFPKIEEMEARLAAKASRLEKMRRDFLSPEDNPIDNWLEIAVVCVTIFGLGTLAVSIFQALV